MNEQPKTPTLSRATYKAIKNMNREQMSEHFVNVYVKGYEAGKKAATPNSLLATLRETLLNVADIGPTRADAILNRLAKELNLDAPAASQEPGAATQPTASENHLVNALLDSGADVCKMCTHNAECNAPENFVEDQEVPREKCAEGLIAYARKNGGNN